MIGAAEYRRHAQEALARGNIDLAVAYLEIALRQDPADRESYYAIGRFLRMSGKAGPAAHWYRECLRQFPDDAVATMGLAALGEVPPPPRLPDDVVRYVFDGNARVYDENMAALAYAIPPVLARLLAREKGEPSATLDILDLGCGSGLCGPLLRPFARRLVGLDLAPRMLALAAQRGAYDALHEGEILGTLTSGSLGVFDAVVAGNVVIYFGDLAPLAAAVAGVLKPAGAFLFDVERGNQADVAGFHTGGRYTHSRALVERAFGPPAYERVAIEEAAMRQEGGVPVPALCCAAVRPGR
jgi:predicted TPR repeat methyltransferase